MIASFWETDVRLEGIDEGIKQAKTEIAKRMLISGRDEDYVHQMTNLPLDEIRSLKHNPA